MSDLIDRKMAIEEISEHGTIWMSYTDDMSAYEIAMEAISNAKDTMIRIIKGLPAVQPEPHWMPCSERLPKESGQYLITVKYEHVDGYEDIYAEHGDWNGEEWDMFCFGHCGKVEDIVAWQSLPAPYKGGDAE